MAIEKVKEYFGALGLADKVMEFAVSSATVELAAAAIGTEGARIAKSLTFRGADGCCLMIVTAGDTKIDNPKFKQTFGCKAKMLSADEVLAETGHAVGGVCPFALPETGVKVYLDESMKRFETVFPACGSANSAIELDCDSLFTYSRALSWVDVCKIPQ
jgi:prolyl-tRNA editing enzyme YbaK/EbsC (Cys-tRNA(Pro) deacylase)